MNTFFRSVLVIVATQLFVLTAFIAPINRVSLTMIAKTLEKGKYVSIKADVFYRVSDGRMVTHFTQPFENITITNPLGEIKIYDPKENAVVQMQGVGYSSKNSFLYNFFSRQTQDMGLGKEGFKLASTRLDKKMVITTWQLKENMQSPVGKIELVHENFLPIYMAFYSHKNKVAQKIFYANYKNVADFKIPFNITEITYPEKADSIIARRQYSDPKTDTQVDLTYLDFKIPANAKVVKAPN